MSCDVPMAPSVRGGVRDPLTYTFLMIVIPGIRVD